MVIKYEKKDRHIIDLNKANSNDSGYDAYTDSEIILMPGERVTTSLGLKFELKLPWYLKLLGIGIEAQVRPKSGRSKSGIDIELGTVDEGYRGFIGATITNTTKNKFLATEGEKICQIVFVPVFNKIKLKVGKVNEQTERGSSGFGSSNLR
jgi:dUTP pyrophosphatase